MKQSGAGVKSGEDRLVVAARLVGRPWTLLIIAALASGPCRFGELTRALPGISTNLLTERLRDLHTAGVIRRGQSGSVATYALTAHGAGLLPIIDQLRQWAGTAAAKRP